MELKPFKFIVQAIMLEMDDEGNPVGEKASDPMSFYGLDALKEFARDFDQHLEKAVSDHAVASGS